MEWRKDTRREHTAMKVRPSGLREAPPSARKLSGEGMSNSFTRASERNSYEHTWSNRFHSNGRLMIDRVPTFVPAAINTRP